MCKSDICDTKPAISLKRSSVEPKLLQSVYRNLCMAYRLVTNLVTYHELWPTFLGATFSTMDISHTFYRSTTNFGLVKGVANRNYSPNFVNFGLGGPMIPCVDMRQSFTDTHVKWFFGNFPMFADSFSVVSIHCIARGLGASFLYKCLASCGGSLR